MEHILCEIRDKMRKVRDPIDRFEQISVSNPLVVDYKNRYFFTIFTANALTLSCESLGVIQIPSGTWADLSFLEGMKLFATNQANLVPVFVRCTDIK